MGVRAKVWSILPSNWKGQCVCQEGLGGKGVQSDFAQFVFVFTVEIVGLLYFDGFSYVGMVGMNVVLVPVICILQMKCSRELSRQRVMKTYSLFQGLWSLMVEEVC
jgi:hypothetical protein